MKYRLWTDDHSAFPSNRLDPLSRAPACSRWRFAPTRLAGAQPAIVGGGIGLGAERPRPQGERVVGSVRAGGDAADLDVEVERVLVGADAVDLADLGARGIGRGEGQRAHLAGGVQALGRGEHEIAERFGRALGSEIDREQRAAREHHALALGNLVAAAVRPRVDRARRCRDRVMLELDRPEPGPKFEKVAL